MKPGETATVGLTVSSVQDLFAIPVMLQYNPAVIQIDEVRNGGFLSGGTQEIAVVQRVDQQRGQAIVSAMRQPNSVGDQRQRNDLWNRDSRSGGGKFANAGGAGECEGLAAKSDSDGVERGYHKRAVSAARCGLDGRERDYESKRMRNHRRSRETFAALLKLA